ncbi:glycosyltransferase [Aurantiacibacter rhizosphaerae]|uniref:glycosyltransferase n=1 Tax=Aurantiacibacter rhizosphaerae TaxID=2691582 RepID=UPI001365D360|nr:glycosyltransferase [Aurantiacibacter rhizosphaerae]
MKILLYAPNYLPATRYGGPVRSSHGLARGLVRRGHRVDVVTTNVDGEGVLDVPVGQVVDMEGVRVRYFPTSAPRRIYYSPEMLAAVESEVDTYDAVHTNGMFLWPGLAIARAAVRARKPLFISPRGMLVPEMIAGKSKHIKRLWIASLERRYLKQASAIHVTSESEADGIRQLGLDLAKVAILPNGVDLPKDEPSASDVEAEWVGVDRGERVAFLARLDWTKGLDLAIEAVARHPTATLLIAGPDQIGLQSALEKQLVRQDGSCAGRFVGQLDDQRKWAFLAGADLLLAPSVKESFGMSVAEALCIGTPVICTPGVGASSIVERISPGLVVERHPDVLAEVVKEALLDPTRSAQLGKIAKAMMAEEYGWDAIADRMAALYRQTQ